MPAIWFDRAASISHGVAGSRSTSLEIQGIALPRDAAGAAEQDAR
jgi:hypothetical protein